MNDKSTPDKSTPDEIRRRFDNDVERFSNLQSGQSATMDAPLVLELITTCAAAANPGARHLLDVGCGAGNYTLKLLEKLPNLNVTLIDLSRPMLDRAAQRIGQAMSGTISAMQGDVRELELGDGALDIILAAAVLHHLRDDREWEAVFGKFHRALRPGGSLWISDFISHESPAVQQVMWQRYGDYLVQSKGEAYREHVFAYVEREDTPRPLAWQLDLLRRCGFATVDVLHKNVCFAAYTATK